MTLPAPYFADASVTLYHGDCREILPHIERVDHVITDPPYFFDYSAKARTNGVSTRWYRGVKDPVKVEIGYAQATQELVDALGPLLAEKMERWLLLFSDVESTWRWRDSLVSAGATYVRTGAWVRTNPTPQVSGDRPGTGYEAVTICHRKRNGRMRWNGGGRAATWHHHVAQGQGARNPTEALAREHPTPKPVGLLRMLVNDFTDEGDVILDPFAGSGTTGVAARMEGRRAILIEREERYCEVAAKRLERMPREDRTGTLGLFDEVGQ